MTQNARRRRKFFWTSMENMQIREFFTDALEVPARNVQSLLKVKIPAVIQFFKIPSRTGGSKRSVPPTTVVGGAKYV